MMKRKFTLLLIALTMIFLTMSIAFADDNGFKARIGDTDDTYGSFYVVPGKTIDLTVKASCDKGSLAYEWMDGNWNVIEGATGATYKAAGPDTGSVRYTCKVSDEYNNSAYIYFTLYVENHLTVAVAGRQSYSVLPGESATLKVKASCDKGSLTYRWVKNYSETIEDATAATFSTGAVNGRTTYYCYVSDQYGNTQYVYFYVSINNKLRAYADGPNQFKVKKGASATLKVEASCYKGDLTYQWQKDYQDIEGATGKTYDTGALEKYASYSCRVSDQYGNNTTVNYSIGIKNDLGVEAVGPGSYVVKPGSSLTLTVNPNAAKGDVTCSWNSYDYDGIAGTDTTLTLKDIRRSMQVYCRVTDIYGNTENEYFDIAIDNKLKAKAKGETGLVVAPNKAFALSVTASCATGDLAFTWSRGYYDSEYNYVSYRSIQNANDASYKEDGVEGTTYYRCTVSDNFGNQEEVEFVVEIDNGFSVSASGDTEITVASGKDVTVKVKAACKSGALHYSWKSQVQDGDNDTYYYSRVLQSETASCTLKQVTRSTTLTCTVSDDYGNSGEVQFSIEADNALTAEAVNGTNLSVKKGGSVTMKVAASCNTGSIFYRWYRGVPRGASSNSWGNPVVGATSNACTIKNIQAADAFVCNVWDEYGNSSSVWFRISLENEFTANIKGNPIVWNKNGEDVKLQVSASSTAGDVTYQWYSGGAYGDYAIKDATNRSYTVPNGSVTAIYSCIVKDPLGNRQALEFLYLPADTPTLAADKSATVDIGQKDSLAAFVFTPSKTGFYSFASVGTADTVGWLYDSEFTRLAYDNNSGDNKNFLISAWLTAGRQYIYIVKHNYSNKAGSFTVTLNSGSKLKSIDMELPLLVGQTVTLPNLYGEGAIKVVEGKCLTMKGSNVILADSAGSATVTVAYDGMVAIYEVTVEKPNNVVKLPAALKKIGGEAFLGDSALKYIEVGENVEKIGAKAFANSALKQIVVMGSKTAFDAKALSGTKTVILCRKGSAAESFASSNKITFAYID